MVGFRADFKFRLLVAVETHLRAGGEPGAGSRVVGRGLWAVRGLWRAVGGGQIGQGSRGGRGPRVVHLEDARH